MDEAQESSAAPDRSSTPSKFGRRSSLKSDQPRAETANRSVEPRSDRPASNYLTVTIDADSARVIRIDGVDPTGNSHELSGDERAKLVKDWSDDKRGDTTHPPITPTGDRMDTTMETEELARLALGGKARRNTRIRRALIARLLNEQDAAVDPDGGEDPGGEGDDEERQLVQALVGTRLLRRRRLRKLLKAKLVSERGESVDESDEGEEETGEGGEDEQELARLLIGSRMFRRRRVRRALLAALVREHSGTTEDTEEVDDESEEDGGEREGKFIRLVIGSRILRRRRVRRAVLAHLLKERAEAGTESDEEEDVGEEGADLEREVARLLVGGRVMKRRRLRRALAHHLANGDDL